MLNRILRTAHQQSPRRSPRGRRSCQTHRLLDVARRKSHALPAGDLNESKSQGGEVVVGGAQRPRTPSAETLVLAGEDSRFIEHLVNQGGPSPAEYAELSGWFSNTMCRYRSGAIGDDYIAALWNGFGEAFTCKTMQGFVARRPHGYHGDFECIDRIYDLWCAPEPHLRTWDLFFHDLAATKAVRNRKTYFIETLNNFVANRAGEIKVLDVGCGSGRCVQEWLQQDGFGRVSFCCVDHDPDATAFARGVCREFGDRARFHTTNAIRALPAGDFDFAWSAGVFDYFSDRVFKLLLKRMAHSVLPGGRIVVGNFSTDNPTRDTMEFGGWKLFHRTREQLLTLGQEAGFHRAQMKVESEAEGVNLFLTIDT